MGILKEAAGILLQTETLGKYFREGIELEKGTSLSEARIIANEELYKKYCNLFTAYPDIYIDLITPVDSNFELYFYQRIFLRASMRFRYHYCVAPRAFSKTFLAILAMYLKCMFQPGAKFFICAPVKEQSAKIAKRIINELWDLFPLLKKEIIGTGNFGSDYVTLAFRNGSIFDVVGALDTERGGRRQGGLIDEVRDHDGDALNEIVLPLLNVSRRTKARIVNPNEPHQAQNYMTSAGTKTSFAYEKLIDLLGNEIINPKTTFIWGCDYRVPLMHNILDRTYLNELRLSPTYKEESFAREYLSLWTGGGEDSWFDFDKMSKYRRLCNPEKSQKIEAFDKSFYLLSVDVGRLSCQTAVCVFRVFPQNDHYNINLVNLFVLGKTDKEKHFSIQAIDLKRIIAAFNPIEVAIDGNGLGVGLLDYMIKPSIDDFGNSWPGYGSFNDEHYKKTQGKGLLEIIYVLKATGPLNSKIHGNCYSKINSGYVQFLIKEQEAKNKLLETKRGQEMTPEQRIRRLMPHEMTTRLFDEMANLKLKPTGNGLEINLESINKRYPKDKFSAFEYGLWRLKEREDEYYKKNLKKGRDRILTFFTPGGV